RFLHRRNAMRLLTWQARAIQSSGANLPPSVTSAVFTGSSLWLLTVATAVEVAPRVVEIVAIPLESVAVPSSRLDLLDLRVIKIDSIFDPGTAAVCVPAIRPPVATLCAAGRQRSGEHGCSDDRRF